MNIETMIRASGLRKQWIADRIDLSPARMSEMLNGRRPFPPDRIPALAKVLGYPAREVRAAIEASGLTVSA